METLKLSGEMRVITIREQQVTTCVYFQNGLSQRKQACSGCPVSGLCYDMDEQKGWIKPEHK